jgi:hypothetical protein
MNDKIQKLANALYDNKECRNHKFEMTLNYKKVIDREYLYNIHPDGFHENTGQIDPILDEEGMKRITEELSKVKVENFNFTMKFDKGQKFDKDGEFDYDIDWYSCSLIFHGKGEIEIAFDMLSSYCSFNDNSFNRVVGNPKITEDKIVETVQKMIELKNVLLENASKLIKKLSEIKKL